MKIISTEDLGRFQARINEGVFVRLDPNREKPHQIACLCSDGEVRLFEQIVAFHGNRFGNEARTLHPYMGEGEALSYSLTSPIEGAFEWSRMRVERMHMVLTKLMPQIRRVTLVHHWPCGMASHARLSFDSSIEQLMRGRERIEHQLDMPGVRVVAHVKVQTGISDEGYKLQSVFVDPEKYVEMLRTKQPLAYKGFMAHRVVCTERYPSTQVLRAANA